MTTLQLSVHRRRDPDHTATKKRRSSAAQSIAINALCTFHSPFAPHHLRTDPKRFGAKPAAVVLPPNPMLQSQCAWLLYSKTYIQSSSW